MNFNWTNYDADHCYEPLIMIVEGRDTKDLSTGAKWTQQLEVIHDPGFEFNQVRTYGINFSSLLDSHHS